MGEGGRDSEITNDRTDMKLTVSLQEERCDKNLVIIIDKIQKCFFCNVKRE